ncbi:exonuclease SbcCD subunit D C-terminal domain-containing protein [Parabacteroides sp. AM08-6]|uniref:exonuclease SbcCD subunit D n=1 Tax=Parabacteroides sp. AM08-6 TaxID=2292053 RepID=UPI000EFDDF3B|nr:exonuclease SbcCD subunit D C-terminal domain-containing protein [Parabacteroides sp. AM08-6]RHJ81471.1 exonuclease subunit SbcD [Parabacteroides sp. AM08-6]
MSLHIIHTADWHLGQTFFGYDREAEHDAFLSWLADTLEELRTDVLLISGDVFDVANPAASAQHRFFRFLRDISRRLPQLQIVITAGNHDSAIRLEAPVPLLEELRTSVSGIIRRTEEGTIDFDSLLVPLYNGEGIREAFCLAVPYLRQGDYPPSDEDEDTYMAGINRMYRQLFDYADGVREPGEALIAMGHLHATGAELSDDDRSERVIMGGLESVSSDIFDKGLAYTALGHIHKAQRVGGRENVRYAGSPLPMSFSEKNYRHQVVNVVLEKGKLSTIETIPVPLLTGLLRIPEQPASPEVVLRQLAELPVAPVDSDKSSWPYLEVQVLLTEPEPGFRHRVEEVLADKAVRLTSIRPSYPERVDEEMVDSFSYTDLQKIDPLDMLRHAFANRYGGELPEELESMFKLVMREVSI